MQANQKYNRPFRYALAMLGLSTIGYMYDSHYISYYNMELNLPMTLIGIGGIAFAIWDAFNDPISGYLSDRTRTKWGRRKPWMFGGVLVLMLGVIMLFSPPASLVAKGGMPLSIYMTVFLMMSETANTISTVNYHSLLPELFRDDRVRNKANSIRQALQIVGMILGISLAPMIAGMIGFKFTAMIIALIGGVFTIYSIFGNKEDPTVSETPQPKLFESLGAISKSFNFWTVTFSHMFYGAAISLLAPAMAFYVRFALEADGIYVTILTAVTFISAIPFMVLWNKLINKFGTVKMWRIALVVFGLSLVPLFFIKSAVIAVAFCVLIGAGIAGVTANLDLVASRLIDIDAEKYGVRREGTYFAVMSFIRRLSSLVRAGVLLLMTALFAFVSGDNPGPAPGSAARFMISLMPVCLMVCSVIFSFLVKLKDHDTSDL